MDGQIVGAALGAIAWRGLRFLLLIYAAVGAYAWFTSDGQMFLPPPSSYDASEPGLVKLPSGDGAIAALYLPAPEADLTLLYSHGNAEDLGQIRPRLVWLRSLGFNVLAYDYRGYGLSDGRPTERGAYADIDAAYRYLVEEQAIAPAQIVAFGRSIGSGPATDLAAREPVGGLVLESAFVSVFRVLTRVPLYPFDKFPNLQKIPQVEAPVLIVHGKGDRTIPFAHGEMLYAAANGPKIFFPVPDAGHNDLPWVAGEDYDRALLSLADRIREANGRRDAGETPQNSVEGSKN